MRLFREPRAPTDPQERAARYRLAKRQRVVAGIELAADFSHLTISIVQGIGQGKYLRTRAVHGESLVLPAELRRGLTALASSTAATAGEVCERCGDLVQWQARLLLAAQATAGKLGEQINAVTLSDPGLWQTEFDGRPLYVPLSNPELLAEHTGVCVIDALPAKDLAAGGHGRPLTPLAVWLALADRSWPVAAERRVVLQVGRDVAACDLPPSDGLDELYPEIRYRLWPATSQTLSPAQHAAQVVGELQRWVGPPAGGRWTLLPVLSDPTSAAIWEQALLAAGLSVQPLPAATGLTVTTAGATWTAILGMLFIDQLPANLTWLTAAATPRILGRVTPGTPAAWRHLLREMADHPPPAMRLRDAV